MSTMLVSVAEFSNILSVIAVLLCFCGMILFITRNMMVLRVHEDLVFPTSLHHHQVTTRVPQMNMMKVHIPFTFKLLETSKSSYADVQYSISSQVKYSIQVYWGVNIRELHICLWRPWSILREQTLNDTLLAGQYQYPGPIIRKVPHGDEVNNLNLTPVLDLGSPPRLCYPLVIFLIRNDHRDNIHPDETVALINVVHIKDGVCPLPTSILAQYLKQANGQLSCLKQLYLATGNTGSTGGYEEDSCGVSGGQMAVAVAEPLDDSVLNTPVEQLCVVCQFFPLSRALLPCRHTCVCASCFDKLERCPMCRGPIKSYFCIRGEEYMPIQSPKNTVAPSAEQQHGGPFYNWLDSWNDRLIDFLGFQR